MLDHFRAVWKLLDGQRWKFGAAIFSLILASCFLYLVPLVPQAVMDGVLAPENPSKPPSELVLWIVSVLGGRVWLSQHLWFPAVVILGLTIFAGAFTYLRSRWSASATEQLIQDLRDRLYHHLQHLSSDFFDRSETGDLVQRCTSDVETIRTFLSTQITEIGRAMIMLLVPIPLMFAMSPSMTLASVCLLPLIVGFSLFFFVKIRNVFKEADEAEGKLTAVLQENLSGVRVVRAFARQEFECDKFDEYNDKHRQLHGHLYVVLSQFWSISDLLCFLQKGLVLIVGIVLLSQGSLGAGAFFFFLAAVNMFLWPMRMMGRILSDLGKALVALERIDEILDAEEEEILTKGMRTPVLQTGALAFENVSFGYTKETPVLKRISFFIKSGQTLALVGPSGSGKSTIVRLLLRLVEPDSGVILIDGHDTQVLFKKQVRSEMAVVMQHPFLYSKSVAGNIKISHPDAPQEEVIKAAKMACVHDSIEAFEKGYETKVGERGVTLSGGQRQRVAIARAFLKDPKILILDDAMSAVDTKTERDLLDILKQQKGKQTTVILAHRLSAVMHAEQILVLQEGQITQSGTHQELLQKEGWYQQLWNAQRSVEKAEVLEEVLPELAKSAA